MPYQSTELFLTSIDKYTRRHRAVPRLIVTEFDKTIEPGSWAVMRLTGHTDDPVELFMRNSYQVGTGASDEAAWMSKALKKTFASDFNNIKIVSAETSSRKRKSSSPVSELKTLEDKVSESKSPNVSDSKSKQVAIDSIIALANRIYFANPNPLHKRDKLTKPNFNTVRLNKIIASDLIQQNPAILDAMNRLSNPLITKENAVETLYILHEKMQALIADIAKPLAVLKKRSKAEEKLSENEQKNKSEMEAVKDFFENDLLGEYNRNQDYLIILNSIRSYLTKKAEWENKFPGEYPAAFIHPKSNFGISLNSSEAHQIINGVLTKEIDKVIKKHPEKGPVELANTIYEVIPALHHANQKEEDVIKADIMRYLHEKGLVKDEPLKNKEKKSPSLQLVDPSPASELKETQAAWTRARSFSTVKLHEGPPIFKCPDFYEGSRIINPPRFGNTISYRAFNPFYWPDAIVGTVCNVFNRGVCALLNPILNGCDKLFAWGKDKPWYKRWPGNILAGLGYFLTVPVKYALIAVPTVIATTTFVVATLGSGNVKDLANLSDLPRAFVGEKQDKAILTRKKTMDQINLERKQSIDLVRKQSISKGLTPSPMSRKDSKLRIELSPANSSLRPSPSGKRSSETSPSPVTPTLPGAIPESPKNLPSANATFKQTHNIVRHSLSRPGRLGGLVGSLDPPSPASPKHKRGTLGKGPLSTVIETPVILSDDKELNTASNEGPPKDVKDSNPNPKPLPNRRSKLV